MAIDTPLPTIVIPAHNRPVALTNLLNSICAAAIPDGVGLTIVIDPGGVQFTQVHQVAQQTTWPFGRKTILIHQQQLGLKGNVFFCGRLAQSLGSIILLEDDLLVSRQFYRYAQKTLDYYAAEDAVAGISLNALWFNGYTRYPFTPILDPYDVFALQVAWYQGQVYTARMWAQFEEWLENQPASLSGPHHPLLDQFPETDWFPIKMKYLIDSGRTYIFPRESHSTNPGLAGTHFQNTTRFFEVPLQHFRSAEAFTPTDQLLASYDSFFELTPSRLSNYINVPIHQLTIDLNGTHTANTIRTRYALTTRPASRPLQTWGAQRRPLIANVLDNVAGNTIKLCRREDVAFGRIATLQHHAWLHAYHNRRPIGRRAQLELWIGRWLNK